ncbi:DUF418 domain-containing protein [Pontibacter anaerobius]|uniref:DUF418 domain-containing protein n=1 Tax=Pontibacter anaerobius TaxID=2993940 RepID=A0ABT3RAS0_9BACT|nr:DUF418 domain-containing protein [Pontibacter anaerobius]MCX2738959.1 DUF418 domain-containing protein [Pontibacter anaerobius]
MATVAAKPVQASERLQVIDVLRGFALIGMIVVHFYYESNYSVAGINGVVSKGIELFVDSRFYTLFAILFGVGFALQLKKSGNTERSFVSRYLRRLLILFAFGIIIEIAVGYNILVRYALCGVPLLLIMKWPTKAVIALALVCAMIVPVYKTTLGTVNSIVSGQESAKLYNDQQRGKMQNFWKENHVRIAQASSTTSYTTAMSIRTESFIKFFSDRERLLLDYTWTFSLFLIGLLSVRAGVFEHIRQRRKLITGFMVFGLLSWMVATWLLPFLEPSTEYQYPNVSYPTELLISYLNYGFMFFRMEWLTFAYAGVILMLSMRPNLFKRLIYFSWAGRMALTNYIIQVALVSLLFNNYAFGFADIEPVFALVYALLLFTGMVIFSRWWLSRYRFGPVEWLWRSATYLRLQPLQNDATRVSDHVDILPEPIEIAPVASGKASTTK